jgi:ABC-type transport system involved in cytochrome c biogenesis permease component
VPLFATSTFLEVMFALLVATPIVILWVAAVVDLLRRGGSGWKLAGILLLILVFPLLGPLLYFVFRKPDMSPAGAEAALMAQEDLRREAARRPTGGTGVW